MDYVNDIQGILAKVRLNGKKEGLTVALQYLEDVERDRIKISYALPTGLEECAVIRSLIENG